MQGTLHKAVEAEGEAASRGAPTDEAAHLEGQPHNAHFSHLAQGRPFFSGDQEGQGPGAATTASQ